MDLEFKNVKSNLSSIQQDRPNSGNPDKAGEVQSVWLTPEQIEEIHADEYSLVLFYATRVQPLSLSEIKKLLPEPESKKAQTVLNRFIEAELVELTSDKKYSSKLPDGYVNYTEYKYDADLEARKDSKVFQLMKEFTGQKEYWKDKTYFSMDGFFSEEQSSELREMFRQIKLKAKSFDNENAKKKSIKDLKFRRFKFYDMFITSLFVLFSTFFLNTPAFAIEAIVQVPFDDMTFEFRQQFEPRYQFSSGGGNDPTGDVIGNDFDFNEPIDLFEDDYQSALEKPYVFIDRDETCSLMVRGSVYSAVMELCSIKDSIQEFQRERKDSPEYKRIESGLIQKLNELSRYR